MHANLHAKKSNSRHYEANDNRKTTGTVVLIEFDAWLYHRSLVDSQRASDRGGRERRGATEHRDGNLAIAGAK